MKACRDIALLTSTLNYYRLRLVYRVFDLKNKEITISMHTGAHAKKGITTMFDMYIYLAYIYDSRKAYVLDYCRYKSMTKGTIPK